MGLGQCGTEHTAWCMRLARRGQPGRVGSAGRWARGAVDAGGRRAPRTCRAAKRTAEEAEGEHNHSAQCGREQHAGQPPELSSVFWIQRVHFSGRPARLIPQVREALKNGRYSSKEISSCDQNNTSLIG